MKKAASIVVMGTARMRPIEPARVLIISSTIISLFSITQYGRFRGFRTKSMNMASEAPAYASTSVLTSETICSRPTL